jgi:hypothetical protein
MVWGFRDGSGEHGPARWRIWRLALLLVPLVACDGQVGCLGCGNGFVYPDPPPPAGQIQPYTLLGHVQQNGVNFITSHFSDILRAQLKEPIGNTRMAGGVERGIFYLPERTYGSSISVTTRDGCINDPNPVPLSSCPARADAWDATRGPTYRSKVELNLDTIDQSLHASFIPGSGADPDGVHVDLYNIDLFLDAALVVESALGNATCLVQDSQVDQAAVHLDQLSFTVNLRVDSTNAFYGEVVDVQVDIGSFLNSDLLNLDVSPCNGGVCSDPYCNGFWAAFACAALCYTSDFVFTMADFLTDVMAPLIDIIAPSLVELAVNSILDEVNGQPLSLSGRYAFDDIFGANGRIVPLLQDPTMIAFGAHPNADAFRVSGPTANRGMSLSLDAATFAEPSPCAPTVSIPTFESQLGAPPFFDGTLQVGDHTELYHMAVGVSEAFAAQAAFSAYSLGAECLFLSAEDLERMSGGAVTLGALSLLVPGLADWGDSASPLMFVVHPTAAPKIRFGTGNETGHDAQGNPIIDSLLQLDLGEMGVSIYALFDSEFQRLATVAADVSLGVPLTRTPQNTIEIGLDRLDVKNVVEVYDEMLPGADYGVLLEVLLNVAIGAMIGGAGDFDLDLGEIVSRMLGGAPVYARINAVERAGADTDKGFIVAYVTFCTEADLNDPTKPPCYNPPAGKALFEPRIVDTGRGFALLLVDGSREYQTKVDGGAWSGFRRPTGRELRVVDPRLFLPGHHSLELRNAQAGRYWTRSSIPQTLDLLIE